MRALFATALAVCIPFAATADTVGITPGIMSVMIETDSGPVEIMRNQDTENGLLGD